MGQFIQRVLDLFDVAPSTVGAKFVHPRASRRIALATCDVAYAFRRAKRRTIGMVIGPDGLEVSAPRWVTVGEIESTLHEKADWIVRKLVEMQEHQRRLGEARIQWRDGVVLRYLGASLQVVLDSSAALKKIAHNLKRCLMRCMHWVRHKAIQTAKVKKAKKAKIVKSQMATKASRLKLCTFYE
jgi:predicted metal-dependent hydrolase